MSKVESPLRWLVRDTDQPMWQLWTVGLTAVGGSWLGALISGFLTDLLGRKKAIMIGAIIW